MPCHSPFRGPTAFAGSVREPNIVRNQAEPFDGLAFTRTNGQLGGGAWEFGCRTNALSDMPVSRPESSGSPPKRRKLVIWD
jgi:hypothetical protein